MTDRKERLKAMIEAQPGDAFPRYGLAMEYKASGELDEAVRLFEELLDIQPEYLPAYYHLGTALSAGEQTERARSVLREGIRLAEKKGETHAREELQAALEDLA